ncbi:LCP family protein [Streptomyces montanisoli]|uniref:LCP family protein n=1 Tax=Streptomyces montanisoli TaxID=2798581 RepID=A0A940MM39_9ACTN|nr:LCP family protein [Streptomyces montanisoli]MBP0461941.1 LCP family protein [Streptomyces montanisoli]
MGQDSARRAGARGRARDARGRGADGGSYGHAADAGAGTTVRTATVPEQRGPGTAPGQAGAGGGGRRGKDGGGGGGRSSRRRKKQRRFRALRWIAGVLSLLVLATAGAGYLYYRHLNGNIRSGSRTGGHSDVNKPKANAAGQRPLNILLIGSDSRASAANVALGGGKDLRDDPPLADVQMLLHVSADRKNASMVSIPRDTRVDIPECKDAKTGKDYPPTNAIINTTLARGGAGCTLSTWEKLTGVYIDHWMTIDFAGVVRMADAIGGVPVCVQENVWDHPTPAVPGGSGLRLKAGTTKVKGKQALQWLRTRHAFASDLGRSKAQHMYLTSMFRQLKSQNYFTSPMKLTGLADAAIKALKVSDEIGSVPKLFDLGMQLKNVPINRMTTVTMPTIEDPQNINHVLPKPGDADQLWSLLRDDVALDKNGKAKSSATPKPSTKASVPAPSDPPAQTAVTVFNGTGGDQAPVPGRARTIKELLVGKGYGRAETDSTQKPQKDTTVLYPRSALAGDAQGVAKALGVPSSGVHQSASVTGVTVIVGADWREGTTYPKHEKPKAGSVPTSADVLNGGKKDACMPVYKPYQW